MTDFSAPQRMSAGAFLVFFTKIFSKTFYITFIPIVIRLFDSDSDTSQSSVISYCLVLLGLMIAVPLVIASAEYFATKFYVRDGNLIFIHGLISRMNLTIPLDKIHTLRTKRGIMYQILGLRGITFDTLATKIEEIELVLSENDWKSLINLIKIEEDAQSKIEQTPESNSGCTIQFDNGKLIVDALCQNHLKGAAVLGGIIAMFMDRLNEISDNATETITDFAYSHFADFTLSPLLVLTILAIVYIAFLLLWLGKIFLRYFDMYLTYTKTLLSFSFGMFSRSGCRFAFDKVCTIWVKRNFFEKRFGLGTMMLRQALNATKDKEEDNLKLYGKDSSEFFLKWWLGEDYFSEHEILTSKSGRGVLTHILVPAAIITIAATLILCHFKQYIWILIPAIYFFISLFNGIFAMRRSRITLMQSYIIVHNGRFADIENYVKYVNIEVVRIVSTPFTKWSHRVTLELSTPGSSFRIRSLNEEEAKTIYELLLQHEEKEIRP